MVWTRAILVSSPRVSSSPNCAASLASAIERTQAVAQREADVVGLHDFADFLEVGVEEILLVMRQAPLGHDRAAAADDAGHALGSQRHIAQQDAGMDGEVVHALLGLFDQGVAEQSQVRSSATPLTFSSAGRSARCRSAPASCG